MNRSNYFKFFCLLPLIYLETWAEQDSKLKFIVIAKSNSSFFLDARDGCKDKAKELNVTCVFTYPYDNETDIGAATQSEIIYKVIDDGNYKGISISVNNEISTLTAINKANESGIHVVTYDNNAFGNRFAHIGTNNTDFGKALGNALLQLDPKGGKYGIISANDANLKERDIGVRDRLSSLRSKWVEVEESTKGQTGEEFNKEVAAGLNGRSSSEKTRLSLQYMRKLADTFEVEAIISCCSWPMNDDEEWKKFVNDYKDITLVIGDCLTNQLRLFDQGYGNGLVGQFPYKMGMLSIETLHNITLEKGTEPDKTTGLQQHLHIPPLPPVCVDNNRLGNLVVLGYCLFGIIVLLSGGFAAWVIINRNHRIVMASQPLFLLPLCLGTLIMGSTIIPMTIEDSGEACMAIPWLMVTGFTLMFSMLFSKTWRVNQIFRHSQKMKRIIIKEKDVILPFTILMVINVILLFCLTFLAPVEYRREASEGTDDWNRVIETYGSCRLKKDAKISDLYFIVPLGIVNGLVLVIATIQAYQARSIEIEFSEDTYILLAIVIMLEAWLVGGPVLLMMDQDPKVLFAVLSILIFVTCVVPLVFIFVPKIRYKTKMDAKKKIGNPGKRFRNQEVLKQTTNNIVPLVQTKNGFREDEEYRKQEGQNVCSEVKKSSISEEEKEELSMTFSEVLNELQED